MVQDQGADETRDEVPTPRLTLASASPRRLALLRQAGIEPNRTLVPDIDEALLPRELPRDAAKRLARAKAEAVAHAADGDFVIGADTVVAVGRRILPKAETEDVAAACLRLLSGRAHRVFTAVRVIAPDGRGRERLVETRVHWKRLSVTETARYLASGEWRGKAGGYAIQGLAGTFVLRLIGSYSAVVGLPLYETISLLEGAGFPVRGRWPASP